MQVREGLPGRRTEPCREFADGGVGRGDLFGGLRFRVGEEGGVGEVLPALGEVFGLTYTLGRVLTNVNDRIYFPDRADGQPRELRLLLNREPLRPRTETQQ